jgi:hypothetical protein
LPGVKTWELDCEHGKLPEEKSAFGAYLELLVTGTTAALAVLPEPQVARGTAAADAAAAHVPQSSFARPLVRPAPVVRARPFRTVG